MKKNMSACTHLDKKEKPYPKKGGVEDCRKLTRQHLPSGKGGRESKGGSTPQKEALQGEVKENTISYCRKTCRRWRCF